MVFLVTVMLLCLPFTCDPVHSVTWFFFYPAWVGEVENSTALSYNLATARCLITERERQERVCVSTCTRGSDKAEQTIGEGSQTHSTPLLRPSEEHVGRISKRTLDSSEGGDKKEQQEHIMSLLDYRLLAWLSVILHQVSVNVGGFGLTLTRSSALCRPYHWFPVMHCCPTPITAGMWNTGQLNHLGIKITSSLAGKRWCCTICGFQNKAWINEWLVYTLWIKISPVTSASHISAATVAKNGAAY